MKKFKKVGSFVTVVLTLSVVLENFSSSVLAYEQARTQTSFGSSRTNLNKTSSLGSSIIEREKSGLEKSQQLEAKKKDYVEGEILVKYKKNKINLETVLGRATALNFVRSNSLEKKEDLRMANISVLRIIDSKTVEQKIAELKNNPNVEYAEPNYKRYPAVINTNDTQKEKLWGLDNTGQTVNVVTGTNDADIDGPEAWTMNEGTSASVIVAVIDSGVAYNHPDLVANMWDGTGCVDENGAVLGGCNHGFDFEDSDNTPLPTNSSHGTHIAGTIAAVKNNGAGIIGVAPSAKIMAIKFDFDIVSEVKAIDFAIQNGAKIINASFGGSGFSQSELDAVNRFQTAGGIFIVAAGNSSLDHNVASDYPCDFDSPNVVCVAATDQNDDLATFSDYGATFVDVGAPGTNIYSTIATESLIVDQTFESLEPPAVPDGWVKGGTNNNWETYQLDDGTFWGNVLYGDIDFPYANTANTTVTSPTYNLSSGSANIDFWARCDTEYSTTEWTDYMALELSGDGGSSFTEVLRWDEPLIDSDTDPSGAAITHFTGSISSQYLTSNFKFRLRWVANGNEDTGGGDGCLVDDITITTFSDGSDEEYDYFDGTSMATPHVAGLAALIEGYNPNLTSAEVKDTILTTGDSVASLSGKTVSGKRINAFNALTALAPTTHTISGTVKYYDEVKAIPNATVILEDDLGAQIATTITDENGFYEFTDVASGGNYVVSVIKDDEAISNGIDVLDLIKTRRQIAEIENFDLIFKEVAADVNNDLSVNILDLVKMRRYIAEIDVLPSRAWKFYASDATLDTTNYLTVGLTRSITNVTTDTPSQDFIGIKMGDVNNSWVNN